jgi:hypothetical protein
MLIADLRTGRINTVNGTIGERIHNQSRITGVGFVVIVSHYHRVDASVDELGIIYTNRSGAGCEAVGAAPAIGVGKCSTGGADCKASSITDTDRLAGGCYVTDWRWNKYCYSRQGTILISQVVQIPIQEPHMIR